MVKLKVGETISLVKSKQKEVVKETKKIKKDIKDGKIIVDRKARKLNAEQKRGLIYIAHIPHGFYENEMRNFFQQFGKITNVKVCRSSQTGNSKGFGYVEFAHPEVAQIAAESMNNYLMFKKRIVAEFVPHEKRPKHLFHGKSSNLTRISSKIRRTKQFSMNKVIDEETHAKRSKSRLSRLNNKLQRLQNMGIDSNFIPTDVPLITKDENSTDKAADIYEPDSCDSEVDFKVKPRKKSVESKKTSTHSENQLLTKKSSTLRKSSREKSLPTKADKGISAHLLANHKKDKKSKGITKKAKTKKPLPLNTQTVKKIARELIRKKGPSLINLVTPLNKSGSTKKTKK